MGLDATVYCNCYEQGLLRTPPPPNITLILGPDGGLSYADSITDEDYFAFCSWLRNDACDHRDGVFLHHRLGNIALIALLRNELSRESDTFPILLRRVLYSGTHAGDYIPASDLFSLNHEVEKLNYFQCQNPDSISFVEYFTCQMRQLSDAATALGKPISF